MIAILFCLLCFLQLLEAAKWAVIVAGSNTWSNYRHQSDVCHAYQVAHDNGIPDDNIIVMQYDDIAKNVENPFPGQVFNKPSPVAPGVDVYNGCKKDYVGRNVTAAKFLAVITGDVAAADGKVLTSTVDDHVFINFVDHGGTGIVAFPVGPYLSESELYNALQTMVKKQMFGQLTFYMEACEAGSMFYEVPDNENIYVTTASNAVESSWATYCPPDDVVDGKILNTCLGDLYSVSWMEDCDTMTGNLSESLENQYVKVQTETTESHVMQYGDLDFVQEAVSEFLGDAAITTPAKPVAQHTDLSKKSSVRTIDVPLHLAYYRYLRMDHASISARHAAAQELRMLLDEQVEADNFFLQLSEQVSGSTDAFFRTESTKSCGSCCRDSYAAYQEQCNRFTDYSIQYTRVLYNLCQDGHSASEISSVLTRMC